MNALLTAAGLRNKRVRCYLPDRYVPAIGYVDQDALGNLKAEGYDCLVYIHHDCEGCFFDALYPASLLDGDPNEARMMVEEL